MELFNSTFALIKFMWMLFVLMDVSLGFCVISYIGNLVTCDLVAYTPGSNPEKIFW